MKKLIDRSELLLGSSLLAWGLLAGAAANAADFAPITASERALTEVPGYPAASAVVLFEKGHLSFLDYPQEVSSTFEVAVRIKILTAQGVERYGEIEIPHSRFLRLREFRGRTVLSDGREIPLPEDAVFREVSSRSQKLYLTKAAFPALEVGAIVDYSYLLSWDSILFGEPWLFHNEVPTLLSEITYEVPGDMAVVTWGRQTTTQEMQVETARTKGGRAMRVWIEDLPPVPEEPAAFPFADLSSRVMVLPKSLTSSGFTLLLLDSWESTCDLLRDSYKSFLKKSSAASKQAKALGSGAASPREQIALLFRFVRDEIRTDGFSSVGVLDTSADKVLKEGSGTSAHKALLLQAMLEALKIDARPVWASNRFEGLADLSVANPGWFDRVLLRVDLDGEALYLDPSDRTLAAGQLSPATEGTQAVLFHAKKPEILTLPQSAAADNVRQSDLRFRLDEDGRLSGEGSVIFGGQHAWSRIVADRSPEDEREAWQEWLEGEFVGFEIAELTHETSVESQRVRLDWSFTQLDEEVLGDESSLELTPPFGPVKQVFALGPSQRMTPVQLRFPDTDQTRVEVSWPEGWTVDVAPQAHSLSNEAGAFTGAIEVDHEARTARYTRRFVTAERTFQPPAAYAALRELYDTAEKHDAQNLVLVAR